MAKSEFTEQQLGELSDRLREIAARLEGLRIAMRVLKVDGLLIDKTAYMKRSLSHLDDFVDHGARSLRKLRPGADINAYSPQHKFQRG